jgi:hypothetical protein
MPDNKCKHCGQERSYSTKYDSYYCKDCNLWLEEYDAKRPKTPLTLKGLRRKNDN